MSSLPRVYIFMLILEDVKHLWYFLVCCFKRVKIECQELNADISRGKIQAKGVTLAHTFQLA
jgi:hypothetical protein